MSRERRRETDAATSYGYFQGRTLCKLSLPMASWDRRSIQRWAMPGPTRLPGYLCLCPLRFRAITVTVYDSPEAALQRIKRSGKRARHIEPKKKMVEDESDRADVQQIHGPRPYRGIDRSHRLPAQGARGARAVVACDLHDELGSLLTAAKLDISFIKSKFARANPELIAKCDRVASMLDQGAALKRRLIDKPPSVDGTQHARPRSRRA